MVLYFLIYELYVYYDMLAYPVAAIGNKRYDFYATRYGCLLRDIRFDEYDVIDLLIIDKRTLDSFSMV